MIQNDWINIEEFLVQREFIKLQQKEWWAQHCHENWLKNNIMTEWFDEYPDKKEDLYDRMYKNLERGLNADGSEKIIEVFPEIGSTWQHHNGATYTVVLIANESSDNVNYPITVVYEGFTNGKIWCKPLSNFLDKMTSISPKK